MTQQTCITPELTTQQRARARARQRCVRVEGVFIAAHVPDEHHGKPYVSDYYGCNCIRCRAGVVHNDADRRAELRREHLARRVLIDGVLVAVELRADRHGTPSASDYYGCQCVPCVRSARLRRRKRTT